MFSEEYLSDEEVETLQLLREINENVNDATSLRHLVKVIDISEA